MIAHEARLGITSAWLMVSAILLFILMAPHLLSQDSLLSESASFRLPHHDPERCFLCGMTRAFIAISHGRPTEALAFNEWSLHLYGVLVLNELGAVVFLSNRIRKCLFSQAEGSRAAAPGR